MSGLESLEDRPVVLIHGPRQCGKSSPERHIGDVGVGAAQSRVSAAALYEGQYEVDVVMQHGGAVKERRHPVGLVAAFYRFGLEPLWFTCTR